MTRAHWTQVAEDGLAEIAYWIVAEETRPRFSGRDELIRLGFLLSLLVRLCSGRFVV